MKSMKTEKNKLDDKQIRFISGNNQPQRIPRSPNQEDREDDDDDERKPPRWDLGKRGRIESREIRVRARDGRGRGEGEGEVKRGESNNLLILHHLLCYFNTHPKKG